MFEILIALVILELLIDIFLTNKYYKLFCENKRLKKELSNNVVGGTELELKRLRHLIKYYANRDKKGY